MYYVLHVCVNLNVIAPILSELYLKEREYDSKCKVEWDFRMFSLGAIVNKRHQYACHPFSSPNLCR